MEVVTGCVTALAGAVIVTVPSNSGSAGMTPAPSRDIFPFYIGLLIILGSLGVMAQAFTQHRHSTEIFLNSEQAGRIVPSPVRWSRSSCSACCSGLYVAMTVYLFAVMTIQGR